MCLQDRVKWIFLDVLLHGLWNCFDDSNGDSTLISLHALYPSSSSSSPVPWANIQGTNEHCQGWSTGSVLFPCLSVRGERLTCGAQNVHCKSVESCVGEVASPHIHIGLCPPHPVPPTSCMLLGPGGPDFQRLLLVLPQGAHILPQP